jgi:hypothetical protein
MVKVVQSDDVNTRGMRIAMEGDMIYLAGFDFNISGKLGTTIYAPYSATIDRVTGALSVAIPAFIPQNMLAAPSGATHFRIVAAGSEVDFANDMFIADTAETAILPLDNAATAVINLVNNVTAASNSPLFLALGIEFYQQVNAQMYPLKNGAYNALQLVQVESAT